MNDLTEKTLSSKIIFQGRLLDVRMDEVLLPNGKKSTREWINHPGASCCIPILPDGKIGLVNQFRYPIGKEVLELPAGKIETHEKPEHCARRELEEEIGYITNRLTLLTCIHPALGFANEKMWIYLADDLIQTKSRLDGDEFLVLVPTKLEEALELVWNGTISDVKTIIGLLWAEKFINN